jgi:hypothetical protein
MVAIPALASATCWPPSALKTPILPASRSRPEDQQGLRHVLGGLGAADLPSSASTRRKLKRAGLPATANSILLAPLCTLLAIDSPVL